MPFDGALTIDRVRVSPSASVQASGTETAVAVRVRRATLSQLGGCVIVIVAVAGADSAVPSDAL